MGNLKTAYEEMVAKEAADDPGRVDKRQKEMNLWKEWKDSGEHPEKMEPLLHSLRPLIRSQVRVYAGHVPIPESAIEAEVTRHVIAGLRKYDPERTGQDGRGAQLSTWLNNQMRGVRRFVINNQNLSRVTEDRARRIGDYQRSTSELTDRHGRPPTSHEIADHMQVSVKMVNKLAQEMRSDLVASNFADDPFLVETPRSREVLRLIEFELTPTELQVFEYLTGRNGKPKVDKTSQIAKVLGWSDSKVSQTKDSISKKIHHHLYE